MSLQELLDRQLAIAAKADPYHCSQCGRDLDRWYYGFPLPLCARCMGARLWGTCPRCGAHVRQSPAGSGVDHGPRAERDALRVPGERDGGGMSAWEWSQVDLTCDNRGCGQRFAGERGLRPTSGETVAMVRKRAAKAGWTLVRKKIGRHNYDQDYCPVDKPEESPS